MNRMTEFKACHAGEVQEAIAPAASEPRADRSIAFRESDQPQEAGKRLLSLFVPDIRCAACTLRIEQALLPREDVNTCRTNLAERLVTVEYLGSEPTAIVQAIESLGFTAVPDRGAQVREAHRAERRQMLMRLGVAGIGMMQVMMFALATYLGGEEGIAPAYRALMNWASLAITTPIALFSAMPFHLGAIRDLRQGALGMDVPVSLAISAAFTLSLANTLMGSGDVYYDSVAMFTFLLLLGRFIEMRSRHGYEDSRLLADTLLPVAARLLDGTLVDVREVTPGTEIKVHAGENVAVDGFVVTGQSVVDESAFTGESVPVPKRSGMRVLAGSRNLDGELVVSCTVPFDEFVINRISAMYREASTYKPRFASLADRAARYFVAGILSLAVGSGIYWYLAGGPWFVVALTVLVVSCPCALSLATPVAYSVALSSLRRFGVVVADGRFLERLVATSRIVFDKTGTLTRGALRIESIELLSPDITDIEARRLAASLERDSSHPIARAFECEGAPVADELKVVPGEGVEGVVGGRFYRLGQPEFVLGRPYQAPQTTGMWVLLGSSELPLAWFRLDDEVRDEAGTVVSLLKADRRLSLLTGDGSAEAERVAARVGIEDLSKGLTPIEKLEMVRGYQAAGDVVLMVGDGINDAGAMSQADASLAVSPVDIMVQQAADATLLRADLKAIPVLLEFAARVRRTICQNVFWAIGYNLSVIPLAVTGVLSPWMAALGMSASSMLVVINANRLGWLHGPGALAGDLQWK